MMTHRQRDLLAYLTKMQEAGASPSYQEMADAIGQASKSGINRLVNALEERGFVRRVPNRWRSIEVVRSTESNICPHCGQQRADSYRGPTPQRKPKG